VDRDDDTSELARAEAPADEPGSGDAVGRVNLSDVAEPDELGQIESVAPDMAALAPGTPLQKALFGVVAILLIALAMFVILQGVFEQKMPV
jgi:hypothetical protein